MLPGLQLGRADPLCAIRIHSKENFGFDGDFFTQNLIPLLHILYVLKLVLSVLAFKAM